MTLSLRFVVRSDVGLLREENEDAAYAGPRLLAVADGMGGHAAGEVASRLAIATLAPLDDDLETDVLSALREAVERASNDIRSRAASDPALDGMGTTLTALLWTGTSLGLAHVGDSRAYLLRDGTLNRITSDHTYVQELVDSGQITADEALSHPQRSLLTRALDGRSTVEPDLSVREVRAGDRYLLCSDGLSGVVRDDTLAIALQEDDLGDAADHLVELALRGGGPDNITVVVCELTERTAVPADPVVAGAAADVAVPTRGSDSPAGRAALSTPRRRRRRAAPQPAEPRPVRIRSRRPLWVLAVGVVLLAVTGGGWLWTRTQYFVGMSGDRVAIFRGVSWSVAGLALHSVSERLAVDPAQLPEYERDRLQDGIVGPTLPQARRVASRLADEQCVHAAATTTATPSPRTPPSAGSGPQPAIPVPPGCQGAAE